MLEGEGGKEDEYRKGLFDYLPWSSSRDSFIIHTFDILRKCKNNSNNNINILYYFLYRSIVTC